MIPFNALHAEPLWHLATRLGEAQILLPAVALIAFALYRQQATRTVAVRWVLLLGVATAITTASKLAFIGWGLGWPALDFTGFSGHSMYAAAFYPLLFAAMQPREGRAGQGAVIAMGSLLAALVGYSRIAVSAHSWSEVISGLTLGAMVSVGALAGRWPVRAQLSPLAPVLLLAWMALTPLKMPPNQTHTWVTRMALALADRAEPYTRQHLQNNPATAPLHNADEKKPAQ